MHIHKLKKKIEKKRASKYIKKRKLLKKLYLNNEDFNKVCIYKGIYPLDHKKIDAKYRHQFNKNLCYTKADLKNLSNEPIINTLREIKTYYKKYNKRKQRSGTDKEECKTIVKGFPQLKLDHIIKQRYPSLSQAVGQLNDALTTIVAYSLLPSDEKIGIKNDSIQKCIQLKNIFHYYVYKTNKITKAFITVKGYYLQAQILQQNVTWILPHIFTPYYDKSIDFKIITTFIEFYTCLLNFILFKLFRMDGLSYPPEQSIELKNEKLGHISYDQTYFINHPKEVNINNSNGSSSNSSSSSYASSNDGSAVIKEETPFSTEQCVHTKMNIKTKTYEDIANEIVVTEGIEKKTVKKKNNTSNKINSTTSNEINNTTSNEINNTTSNEINNTTSNKTNEINKDKISSTPTTIIKHYTNEDNHNKLKNLFKNFIFYIHTDMPFEVLSLIILSCGGKICWKSKHSPYKYDNKEITHEIIETEINDCGENSILERDKIQPQYIFDCLNRKEILYCFDYQVNKKLPIHLSPFIEDENYKDFVKTEEYTINKMLSTNYEKSNNNNNNNNKNQKKIGQKMGQADEKEIINTDIIMKVQSDDEFDNITLLKCRNAALQNQKQIEKENEKSDVQSQENSQNKSQTVGGNITETDSTTDPVLKLENLKNQKKRNELERKKMLMSKKKRKLYNRIENSEKRQKQVIQKWINKTYKNVNNKKGSKKNKKKNDKKK
ncbi:pescadillo homolog [Hepatocystis sp. ex Piliocolobus tephrosceles]|nr:pescadillo homolog [Hepatocystis sp. ex Piliocolobus tephrosceles]